MAKRKRDALDYFTFDSVAWLSSPDVTRMSAAQRGAYIQLLAIESRDKECSLPDDDAALADITKLGDAWSTDGVLVRAQFIAHPKIVGRLINSRLFREWKTAWRNYRKACKRNKQNRLMKTEKNDDSSTSGQRVVTQISRKKERGTEVLSSSPKQPAPIGAKSWITPYAEAWKARYGGDPDIGPLLKALSPPRRMHGDAVTLARWKLYLGATPAEFTNPAKFAATFGEWTPEALAARRNGKPQAVQSGVRATTDTRPAPDLEPARAWVRECGGAEGAKAKVREYAEAHGIAENIARADIAPPFAYLAIQEAERKAS